MNIFKIFNEVEKEKVKPIVPVINHKTITLYIYLNDKSRIYWSAVVKNEEETLSVTNKFKKIISDIDIQLCNLDRIHLTINENTVVIKSQFSHAIIYEH